jgi:GT2 family glycosyltransferase
MSKAFPRVRVIIPAHNEAHRIRRCLETAIPAAREREWEVLVVDDGSTDNTAALAESLGAQVIRKPLPLGVAAARNAGAHQSDADVLVFLDADIIAPERTLHVLVDRLVGSTGAHATGAYPAMAGNTSCAWSTRFDELRACMAFCRPDRTDVVGFSTFQSECGAILREAFEALGGFSEAHAGVGMEEYDFAHRLERQGYVNVLLRDAPYAHHYKPVFRRARELVRRTARWVPLLLRRRKLESSGAVGSSEETLSCLLSGVMICAVVIGVIWPIGWAAALLAVVLQWMLEWPFLRLARQTYGPITMLCAWGALQVFHVAIALGFGWGLFRTVLSGLNRSVRPDHPGPNRNGT